MPVLVGSHQLVNHVHLAGGELMRRYLRARPGIVEFTWLFAIPVVIP
jgi:hypothetical protein